MSVLLPNVDSLLRSRDEDSTAGDRLASYRNAIKIYTFFLVHIVLIEEAELISISNTVKVMNCAYAPLVLCYWLVYLSPCDCEYLNYTCCN